MGWRSGRLRGVDLRLQASVHRAEVDERSGVIVKGPAAKLNPIMVGITTFMVLLIVGLIARGFLLPRAAMFWGLLIPLLLGLIALACYLRAPVSYEITPDNRLVVTFRWGSRQFAPVKSFHRARARVPFALRLWGNGGVFAATGIYWNRAFGVFHAYVTDQKKLVVVELQNGKKVVISPANTEEWNEPGAGA